MRLQRPVKVEYPRHHEDAFTIVNQSLIHILAFLIELAQKVQSMSETQVDLSFHLQKILTIYLVAQTARCFGLARVKDLIFKKCKEKLKSQDDLGLPVFDPLP